MGPESVKKGLAQPLLSPFRPIFHMESPTDFLKAVLLGRRPLGVGQTPGSAERRQLPSRISLGEKDLLLFPRVVAKVSIPRGGGNRPIQPI
jgi:hypothetical protein